MAAVPTPAAALFRIRIAMITGVVVFSVTLFTLKRNGMLTATSPPEQLANLRIATLVAAVVAVAGLVALRNRIASAPPERRSALTILAWAFGEFAALFGLAFYMVSGAEGAAAPGLIAFAIAMIFFPAAARA